MNKKRILIAIVLLLLLIGLGVGVYLFANSREAANDNKEDGVERQVQNEDINGALAENPIYFTKSDGTYKLTSIDSEPLKISDEQGFINPDETYLAFTENASITLLDLSNKQKIDTGVKVSGVLHSWSNTGKYLLNSGSVDRGYEFEIYKFDDLTLTLSKIETIMSDLNYVNWIGDAVIIFPEPSKVVTSAKTIVVKLDLESGVRTDLYTPEESNYSVLDLVHVDSGGAYLTLIAQDEERVYEITENGEVNSDKINPNTSIRKCIPQNHEEYFMDNFGGNNLKILNARYFAVNLRTGLTVFDEREYLTIFDLQDCSESIYQIEGTLVN